MALHNIPTSGTLELEMRDGKRISVMAVTKEAKDGTKTTRYVAHHSTKHNVVEIPLGGPNGAVDWHPPGQRSAVV